MRFLACLCLLALGAARLTATPDEPVSWPVQGPYITVGQPGFRLVRMPVPMVEAVQRVLREDPAKWEIVRLGGVVGRQGLVLETSSEHDLLNLLFKQGHWVNLCAPAAVPWLNGVVRTLRPADLHDEEKLANYFGEVLRLHYGGGAFLTKDFERHRLTEDRISYWLGDEKRPEALLSLCHDPVVARNQDRVTIQCNALMGDGSVKRFTFHLRVDKVDKTMRVEAVETVRIRKKGSFYYALLLADWDGTALPKQTFRISRVTQALPG